MTPFEKAEANAKKMAERLILHNLIMSTIKDCEQLTEAEQDVVWLAVLTLLEKTGAMDEIN